MTKEHLDSNAMIHAGNAQTRTIVIISTGHVQPDVKLAILDICVKQVCSWIMQISTVIMQDSKTDCPTF